MNEKIITLLRNISILLEVKGENIFKTNAYKTAADIIETQNLDIEELVNSNKLSSTNGFGKALTEKITEYVKTGSLQYYQDLIQEIPESLIELNKIEGLGIKKIKTLFEKLEIKNLEDLKIAAKKQEVSKLQGFGKKTEENILNQLT